MASFQAKIGQKMMKKSENKNYRSVSFQPIKNIKKNHYGVISSQNRLENDKKEKK